MRVVNINSVDNFSNCSFEAKIKLPREVILRLHNEGLSAVEIAKKNGCK